MVRKTSDKSALAEAEPAWEIARLFPNQGDWSEEEYLALTRDTNHFVEFADGFIEVLPMPTLTHQRIVGFVFQLLSHFVSTRKLGEVILSPYKVRLRPELIREPDIILVLKEHADRMGDDFSEAADLVLEVVSDDRKSRKRDLERKRREYAEAGISEYWLIDPQQQRITVLKLTGEVYAVHCECTRRDRATSALLPGFELEAEAVFAAAGL